MDELELEELIVTDEDEFEDVDGDEDGEDEEELEDLSTEQKLQLMATAADSLRATDIVALELRALTIIADYFLVCTGKSSIQIRAIADRIEERMRNLGYRKLRLEGYREATWILLDYGDIVVHVMAEESRAFYRLEQFWSEAPLVELELVPEPMLHASTLPD